MSSSKDVNFQTQSKFNNSKDSIVILKKKENNNSTNSIPDNIQQNLNNNNIEEPILNTSNFHIQKPKTDYDKIKKLFTNIQHEGKIDISLKTTMLNYLYIYIYYFSRTEYNFFKNDVIFCLIISPFFPDDPPQLTCKSNFIFPTLFDNRELLESVLGYKWVVHNEESSYLAQLESLIIHLHTYVHKLFENKANQTLVYYGRYIKNCVYQMNDFIENTKIQFYHVLIYESRTKKERFYAILTELYLLLFKPVEEAKGKGELIMMYDLFQLKEYKERMYHRGKKKESVVLKFKNGVSVNILIFNETLDSFVKLLSTYQETKDKKYKLIQYENFFEKSNLKNVSEVQKLIEFKEKLFSTQKKTYVLKQELHFLYQKMIELSKDNKEVMDVYLNKLNTLMKEESCILSIVSKRKEEKNEKTIHANETDKRNNIDNDKKDKKENNVNDKEMNVDKCKHSEIENEEQNKKSYTEIKDFINDKPCQNYSSIPINTGHDIKSLIKFFSGNQSKK